MQRLVNDGHDSSLGLFTACGIELCYIEFARRNLLRNLLRLKPRLNHGISHPVCDATRKSARFLYVINHHVWERSLYIVNSIYPEESQYCSLGTYRGMSIDKVLHIMRNISRMRSCTLHDLWIKIKLALHSLLLLKTVTYIFFSRCFRASSIISLGMPSMSAILSASFGTSSPDSTRESL